MEARDTRHPETNGTASGGGSFAIYTPGGAPPAPAAEPAFEALDEFFWGSDEDPSRAADRRPAPAESRDEKRRWLTFSLGEEEYALDIGSVREILKPPPITEVPRAPSQVLGVVTVRGEVIPVFDARRRIGLPPREPGRLARVVICDAGEGLCGLLVDAVRGVVRLPASAVEPRPQGVGGPAADLIAGLGRDRERLLVLLDAPLLFRTRSGGEGA